MTKRSENKRQAEIEALVLPDFVTFAPSNPRFTLSAVAGVILVDNDPSKAFSSPAEAYDTMRKLHGREIDFIFDKSLGQKKFGTLYGGMFFAKPEKGSTAARLLISYTHDDHVLGMKHEYAEFLRLDKQYQKSPGSWALAHQWLSRHPAFWSVSPHHPFTWDTDGGLEKVHTYVSHRKGVPVVYLETGATVEPERTRRYHDIRMDTRASSFEKAYVKLAKKVNRYYNTDGSEK